MVGWLRDGWEAYGQNYAAVGRSSVCAFVFYQTNWEGLADKSETDLKCLNP